MQESDTEQGSLGNAEDEPIAFSAHLRYKLLDVLVAIVGFFGTPIFDSRYQPEVDEDLELFERLNRAGQEDIDEEDLDNDDDSDEEDDDTST